MYTVDGFTGTSTVYIHKNNGGNPGTIDETKTFTPSSNGWLTVNLTTQPSYNGDFFIVVALAASGAGYYNTCLGLDGGVNAGSRMIAYDYGMWKNPTTERPTYYTGDFMIRAIVTYVGVEENAELGAKNAELKISPNPISKVTNIQCLVPNGEKEISLKIYDLSGKVVKSFSEYSSAKPDCRQASWDKTDDNGNKVSSGIYFCKLKIGSNYTLTKTLVVL